LEIGYKSYSSDTANTLKHSPRGGTFRGMCSQENPYIDEKE